MALPSNSDIIERPLLVVGAPRSGTTWLIRTLLQDRRLVGGQESHFLKTFGASLRAFDEQRGRPRPTGLACYWRRAELVDELQRLWRKTFEPMVALRPEARLLVEKTPDHALWLDVAREVVPGARVLHIVRDSRAVVASLLAASKQ
ncbi:MAG: sulfotransferase family protein, partial [bacterium]